MIAPNAICRAFNLCRRVAYRSDRSFIIGGWFATFAPRNDRKPGIMTAYLISLALLGVIMIAIWDGVS